MFAFLNPFLLWGLAAVAAPVLIHLLLRQRPRPRPWAAMVWLQRALETAQRRYRLTNLLLLILRCLVVALLALALARPSLRGLGSGGRVIVIVDTTASMGPRGDGPGALAEFRRAIEQAEIEARGMVVAAVDEDLRLVTGPDPVGFEQAQRAIARLRARPLPGGLDGVADEQSLSALLALCGQDCDVLLVSDFRQDDGGRLQELLGERVRSVHRLRLGRPGENARIAGVVALPDPLPEEPAELMIRIVGDAGRALRGVDGATPVPVDLEPVDGVAHLPLQPMAPGRHQVSLELDDDGLRYDDHLALPLLVRPSIPAVTVARERSLLGTALAADSRQIVHTRIAPADLATQPLPVDGLLVLRDATPLPPTVTEWLRAGGVVWISLATARALPRLAPLLAAVQPIDDELVPGGPLACGDQTLDTYLDAATVAAVPAFSLPDDAEVVLRAGTAPLVVAVPVDDGHLICELLELEELDALWRQGASTLWVRRTVRAYTARHRRPLLFRAGSLASADRVLHRPETTRTLRAGSPIVAEPGIWRLGPQADARPAVVLPAASEGRLALPERDEIPTTLADALPKQRGADWALPLLLATLLLAVCEGAVAAWAGRTYGR